MPFLVDGNNLLGLRPELLAKDPGVRGRLVTRLASFARQRRTTVTVVFDGEPESGGLRSDMALGAVRVIFSGVKSDADRRILDILDAARDPAGITLVTSDRALADRARQRRARCVTSIAFRRTLEELAPQGAGEDAPLTPDQVAEWETWFQRKDP
jgi:predicted RNA-binding protein with PIN domain